MRRHDAGAIRGTWWLSAKANCESARALLGHQSPAIQSQRDSIGGLAPYRGAEIQCRSERNSPRASYYVVGSGGDVPKNIALVGGGLRLARIGAPLDFCG
jgi:hypothetical protein